MSIAEDYCKHKFDITACPLGCWHYRIYGEKCPPYDYGVIVGMECFAVHKDARRAAMDRIDILEHGEYIPC